MSTVQEIFSKRDTTCGVPNGLQIALDTLAYGQNIPLRILNVQNLKNVPRLIKGFVCSPSGQTLLKSEISLLKNCTDAEYNTKTEFLYCPKVWNAGVQWVLSLANVDKQKPDNFFADLNIEQVILWRTSLLVLLPHIERKVWLTAMGNPLPGHVISRMVEHWALYVLCWTYSVNSRFDEAIPENEVSIEISNVLGVKNYTLRSSLQWSTVDNNNNKLSYALVTGPFWQKSDQDVTAESRFLHLSNSEIRHQAFIEKFNTFVLAASSLEGWVDAYSKSPQDQEIADGFASRLDFTQEEVILRSDSAHRSLVKYLLPSQIDSNITYSQISRANWESIAVLSCWLARWDDLLQRIFDRAIPNTDKKLRLAIEGHSIGLELSLLSSADQSSKLQWQLEFKVVHAEEFKSNFTLLNNWLKLNEVGVFIDDPEMFFNRLRERQNASWTAQIVAVNNLLSRQTPKESDAEDGSYNLKNHDLVGQDDIRSNENKIPLGEGVDEVGHLLRGYAGRICQHLLGMIRADVADIYWMDYSQTPPRLVHAGGYATKLAHRIDRTKIHRSFDKWAWRPDGEAGADIPPAKCLGESESQAYRVAFLQQAEFVPNKYKSDKSAYFESYPEPKPKSGVGVPLLINGRTVGVLTFAGLHAKQFDDRVLIPLRRAAQLIGQTLYQASLLWHMRQLNWLVTHTSFSIWKQHDVENQFNPLKKISECLTNVFLCRAVHIWLQAPENATKYLLHGYNNPVLFKCQQKSEDNKLLWVDLKEKPLFIYKQIIDLGTKVDLMRAYSCFVLDKAKNEPKTKGFFTVARHIKNCKDQQGLDFETTYTQEQAAKGMWLHEDFINADTSTYEQTSQSHATHRSSIFTTHGLNDMMACVLMKDDSRKKSNFQAIGVLTLHDVSKNNENIATCQSAIPPQPWSTAWAPIVSHIQTYLPYLFQQVDLLNSPVENMRRFLLHSVRSELIPVRDNMRQLRSEGIEALHPNGIVRRRLREMGLLNYKAISGSDSGEIFSVEQHLDRTWAASQRLVDDVPEHNINRLIVLIEKHAELAELGAKPSLSERYFDIKSNLESAIEEHSRAFQEKNLIPSIEGFRRPLSIRVEKMWWGQLISNLVENAAKYAIERYSITWQRSVRSLTFSNIGYYDPEIDEPERLLRAGVRGSAAAKGNVNGLGLGLWGIPLLCELLDIRFQFTIHPQSATLLTNRILAEYRFVLTLPDRLFI